MKNIISNKDIFTLSQIKGIGNRSLFNIVDSGHSIDNLISLDDDELGHLIRGSGKKNAIYTIKNDYSGQREQAELNLEKLKIVKSPTWPMLILSSKLPPITCAQSSIKIVLFSCENFLIKFIFCGTPN